MAIFQDNKSMTKLNQVTSFTLRKGSSVTLGFAFCFFIKGDRILQRKGFLNALVSCAEIIFSDDRIKDTIQKRGIAKKIILIIQTLWACFSNFFTPESMTWK